MVEKRLDKLYDRMTIDERVKAVLDLAHEAYKRHKSGRSFEDITLQIGKIHDSIKRFDEGNEFNQKYMSALHQQWMDHWNLSDIYYKTILLEAARIEILEGLHEAAMQLVLMKYHRDMTDVEEVIKIATLSPLTIISEPEIMPDNWRDDPQLFYHLLMGSELERLEEELSSKKELSAIFGLKQWSELWEVEKKLIEELKEIVKKRDTKLLERLENKLLSSELVGDVIESLANTILG